MKSQSLRGKLLDAARTAQKKAYCPYSKFAVGAAVLAEDGKIYAGCNVENASYGSSMCAERNAVSAAVSAGNRRLSEVVVLAPFSRPCGACRQVMLEFSDKNTKLLLVTQRPKESRLATTVFKMLPAAFNPREAGLKPAAPGES